MPSASLVKAVFPMIDLHCHILPGVDDGPPTLAEAVSMARIAVKDGVKIVVATPHAFAPQMHVTPDIRDAAILALRHALQEASIPLTILPGSDCHLSDTLLPALESTNGYFLNATPNAFLLEWPADAIPTGFDAFLFAVLSRGWTPVLTHPERHCEIIDRPRRLAPWVERGLLCQITADSLLNRFGRAVRRCAETLLKRGWGHLLASDAHRLHDRPPGLSSGLARARALIGDRADAMVTENAAAIIDTKSLLSKTIESDLTQGRKLP